MAEYLPRCRKEVLRFVAVCAVLSMLCIWYIAEKKTLFNTSYKGPELPAPSDHLNHTTVSMTPRILEDITDKNTSMVFDLPGPAGNITLEGPLRCYCKVAVTDGKHSGDRAWKAVYAQLRGHTLYLFKDKNNLSPSPCEARPISVKSSIVEIEYGGKSKNVFRVIISTGSEYLFEGGDRETMLQWSRLIKANAANDENRSTPCNNSTCHGKCDFPEYRRQLRLSGSSPVLPKDYLAGCTKLVYNRVPKCASRTMYDVFRFLAPINHYSVIFIGKWFLIDAEKKAEYLRRMTEIVDQRFVLVSHHYFHNWTSVYKHRILFINIVREPSSWFVSNYNFHKYKAMVQWAKRPIIDCIYDNTCFEHMRSLWGPMSFLCGQDRACFRNSQKAMQTAKRHIEEEYLLVGTIEQLGDFNEVLEYMLPGMFLGLQKTFNQTQAESKLRFENNMADPMTDKVLQFLKEKMNFENEMYAFAKQRFQQHLAIVRQARV